MAVHLAPTLEYTAQGLPVQPAVWCKRALWIEGLQPVPYPAERPIGGRSQAQDHLWRIPGPQALLSTKSLAGIVQTFQPYVTWNDTYTGGRTSDLVQWRRDAPR